MSAHRTPGEAPTIGVDYVSALILGTWIWTTFTLACENAQMTPGRAGLIPLLTWLAVWSVIGGVWAEVIGPPGSLLRMVRTRSVRYLIGSFALGLVALGGVSVVAIVGQRAYQHQRELAENIAGVICIAGPGVVMLRGLYASRLLRPRGSQRPSAAADARCDRVVEDL